MMDDAAPVQAPASSAARRTVFGPLGSGALGLILGALPGILLFLYETYMELSTSERPLDFKPFFYFVITVGGAVGMAISGAVVGWFGRRPMLLGAVSGLIVWALFAAILSILSGGELDFVTAVVAAGLFGLVWGAIAGLVIRVASRLRQPG